MIDITKREVFSVLACFCIIAGTVIGFFCYILFDTVSHIQMPDGRHINGIQISPFWGAVFIMLMAVIALLIALTFRFVPMWVANYLTTHETPKEFEWVKTKITEFNEFLKQHEVDDDDEEKHDW
jgi:H+/Cl- antiporter ClcA